jgi:hypothetical protein
MQICCPQNFGKRRHSGEIPGKSQLKADIFIPYFRRLFSNTCLNGQKDQLSNQGKRLRRRIIVKSALREQKNRPDGQNLQ